MGYKNTVYQTLGGACSPPPPLDSPLGVVEIGWDKGEVVLLTSTGKNNDNSLVIYSST